MHQNKSNGGTNMEEIKDNAISKLKEMRSTEFKMGYDFIIQNIEQLGLAAIEEIGYPREENHEVILYDMLPLDLADEILGYRENDNEFAKVYYIVSSDFIRGMTVAAKKLLEKSKEVTF